MMVLAASFAERLSEVPRHPVEFLRFASGAAAFFRHIQPHF